MSGLIMLGIILGLVYLAVRVPKWHRWPAIGGGLIIIGRYLRADAHAVRASIRFRRQVKGLRRDLKHGAPR